MVDLEEIENEMKKHPDPVLTVADVVEAVEEDASDTHVRQQLRGLEAVERVRSKDIGARAVAWWHVERVTDPFVPPEDHPDQQGFQQVADRADQGDRAEPAQEGDEDREQSIEDICLTLDLAGSGKTLAERRAAVQACAEYLSEQGEATRSDFVNALFGEHTAGYGSEGGWWNEIGKNGLRTLAEAVEEIDAPGEGEHKWRWTA